MTKDEKIAAVQALSPERAKELLETIVVDCLHMGRPMLNDSEILSAVVGALEEAGLDDGSEASEQELFGTGK